jgi:hypothetical protein
VAGHAARARDREPDLTGYRRFQHRIVEDRVLEAGAHAVEREPPAVAFELRQVLREAHVRGAPAPLGAAAVLLVEDTVGEAVGLEQVRHHGERQAVVALRGRPHSFRPAAECVDLGLVHRAPPVDLAAELARAEAHERAEVLDGLGILPAAAVRDPQRIREVVERDQRAEAASLERLEHRVVVSDGGPVDAAALRHDAAPLERQAVRIVAVALREREVLVEALVVPARRAAHVAAVNAPRDPLEAPPVVLLVAALDLVGGGGGAPMESGWEAAQRAGHPEPEAECRMRPSSHPARFDMQSSSSRRAGPGARAPDGGAG